MAIETTWQSEMAPRAKDGDLKRYVRWDAILGYVWCEKQERSRFDRAQGYCSADDVDPRSGGCPARTRI